MNCTDKTTEVFIPIRGYEGIYGINKAGMIKSYARRVANSGSKSGFITVHERFLKPTINGDGYPMVQLNKDGKSESVCVHLLMARHFIEKSAEQESLQVNHIDGNKLNFSLQNLEWCTPSENIQHAFKVLSKNAPRGAKNGNSKKVIDQVTGEIFETVSCAARHRGLSMKYLSMMLCGKCTNKTTLNFL